MERQLAGLAVNRISLLYPPSKQMLAITYFTRAHTLDSNPFPKLEWLHGDLSDWNPQPRRENSVFWIPACKQRLSRTPAATSACSRWRSKQDHALVTPQEPQCIVESLSAAALSLSHERPCARVAVCALLVHAVP